MHVKRLAALPDAEFQTVPPLGARQALVTGVAAAVALPPCLKVKWLRAECLARLDLKRPGPAWTPAAWQRLVFCLHATPHLAELRVRLPCVSVLPSATAAPFKPDSAVAVPQTHSASILGGSPQAGALSEAGACSSVASGKLHPSILGEARGARCSFCANCDALCL